MQVALIKNRRQEFENELNALLLDGWRVVPGTFAIVSVEVVAHPNCPPHMVSPGGTTFDRTHFITLERHDIT
jgi:hypothetical protein